jgi:nitrate reductase gamma subunit
MDMMNVLVFVAFPYITLTIFVAGHALRYLTDRYGWTARSSEFLEKDRLAYGATVFHWGMLLVLFGHIGGLLIPQRFLDLVGINGEAHSLIAHYSGIVTGGAAFVGLGLLIYRRMTNSRVRRTTTGNDLLTVWGLLLVICTGLYAVFFGDFYILDTVAPWIRSIVTFRPDPSLMLPVPLSYKVHIISALALLAFSPFSRLVHIWSAPLGYFFRGWIEYRRRIAEETAD